MISPRSPQVQMCQAIMRVGLGRISLHVTHAKHLGMLAWFGGMLGGGMSCGCCRAVGLTLRGGIGCQSGSRLDHQFPIDEDEAPHACERLGTGSETVGWERMSAAQGDWCTARRPACTTGTPKTWHRTETRHAAKSGPGCCVPGRGRCGCWGIVCRPSHPARPETESSRTRKLCGPGGRVLSLWYRGNQCGALRCGCQWWSPWSGAGGLRLSRWSGHDDLLSNHLTAWWPMV